MGLEIITDELIEHLLRTRKTVHNPKARKKRDSGSERVKYAVSDVENNQFSLYVRQNYKAGMADDFSCGLSYLLANGELFTLARYNGSSHIHTNKLDGTKIDYACHIHRATRLYLDETGNSGGYAEKTNRYRTLAGALYCLLKDCNIEGLPADPDQPELLRYQSQFESLLVFSDFESINIPKNDINRLMNVGGEMVASLDAKDALSRKILKRVA